LEKIFLLTEGSPSCIVQAMNATCTECNRIFDLTDETDAEEWAYGHDCEDE